MTYLDHPRPMKVDSLSPVQRIKRDQHDEARRAIGKQVKLSLRAMAQPRPEPRERVRVRNPFARRLVGQR